MIRKYPYSPACAPLLLLFLLSGCYVRQAYYVSPFNGNTGDYQTIPLRGDSIRSAIYASGAYFTGSANENGKDYFNAFHTRLSRSHNLGKVQAYYGLDLTLGSYFTGSWDSAVQGVLPGISVNPGYRPPFSYSFLNQFSGNHFFGGTGFNAGMNLVAEFDRREWRWLGFETSLVREFGRYLQFRKQLPDSAATLIVRDNFFGTIGITTELLGRTNTGQFGFKWAGGWVLGNAYNNLHIHDNESGGQLGYGYFNFTFHYSWSVYTGFLQVNSATKATALHLGVNIRL